MRGLSFERFVVGLLFVAIACTACLMPAQSDTYWHLRAGQDFWAQGRVPLIDTYSHTAAGRFWPNHEWLWQAATYPIYRLGGFPLLLLAGAALVTAAFAAVYRLTVGPVVRRFWLMVLGVPLSACVWALRPQIASLALLALLLVLVARERYRWLPPLFVLWANVHGGVALGGVVLAAVALAALLRARSGDATARRRAWTLAGVTVLCAAATAATPLHVRLYPFIVESMARSRAAGINEWLPSYPTAPLEIGFWVLALAFLALVVVRRRLLRAWPDVALVAAALALFPLAVRASRNIAPFLLVAIPAASRLIHDENAPARAAASPDRPALNLALFGALLGLAVAAVATAWLTGLPRLGWRPVDGRAIAALKACDGPLYNQYNEGGFLIWLARDKPVFIDSRQDPYPLDFELAQQAVESQGGDPRPLLARYGARCAFLPVASPTLPTLRGDGWRTRYRGPRWEVLEAPARP